MRTTKNISITMPVGMLKNARRLAKRQNRTMSELMREALRRYEYVARQDEKDEEMVAKIIEEVKNEPPMTRKQRMAEYNKLSREMAKYARPDLTDEDIVRMIHEMRGVPYP